MSLPPCYRCEGMSRTWQKTCPACEGTGRAALPYQSFKPGDRVIGTAEGGWAGRRGTVREAAQWDKAQLQWHMRVQPDGQTDEEHASMQTLWDPANTVLLEPTPTVDELSQALQSHPKLLFALMQEFHDTLPAILGPWTRDDDDNDGRHDIFNRRVAYVQQTINGWTAVTPGESRPFHGTVPTAEEARTTVDTYLTSRGWRLL